MGCSWQGTNHDRSLHQQVQDHLDLFPNVESTKICGTTIYFVYIVLAEVKHGRVLGADATGSPAFRNER